MTLTQLSTATCNKWLCLITLWMILPSCNPGNGGNNRPPGKPLCTHYFTATIRAQPDTGQIAPDVLVQTDTVVQLTTYAAEIIVCHSHPGAANDVVSEEDIELPATVQLSFRPRGGLATNASSLLSTTTDNLTTFTAQQRGTYVATVVSKPRRASTVIEAADPFEWISIGPDGRSSPGQIGRVNDIAFDPKGPATYVASARGGVYRSDDGGARWYPMSDHKVVDSSTGQEWVERLAVARVLVTTTHRVLAATGDTERTVGSIEANFPRGTLDGLYFSDDGGVTWQKQVGSNCPSQESADPGGRLSEITRLLAAPSGTLFLSSGSGVFRSTSNGSCWADISPDNHPAIADLAVQSRGGKTILYATLGAASPTVSLPAVLLTTPDAETASPAWSGVTVATNASGSIDPTAITIGTTKVAASNSAAYAVVAETPASAKTGGSDQLLVFRADATSNWAWQRMSTVNACFASGAQCLSYNLAIAASPNVANDVVVSGNVVNRSVDGGATWTPLNALHVDQHAAIFDPNRAGQLWIGNDGGLETARLRSDGTLASSWQHKNVGMDSALFFGMTMSAADPLADAVAGGLQDNGTLVRVVGRLWNAINGGDGGSTVSDSVTPGLVYSQSTDGLNIYRSSDGAIVGQAISTFDDPFHPGTFFGAGVANAPGSFKLYVASGADTAANVFWNCADPTPGRLGETANAVVGAPDGTYYVGTSAGKVYSVPPNRIQWGQFPCSTKKAAPGSVIWAGAGAFGAPGEPTVAGQVVSLSAASSSTLYVSTARFDQWRIVRLDLNPSTGTWSATPVADNFPHAATHSCLDCKSPFGTFIAPVIADPFRSNRVYVGTNRGIFVGVIGPDGTTQWTQDRSFPEIWVESLRVGTKLAAVRAASFGRGVWEQVFTSNLIGAVPTPQPTAVTLIVEPTSADYQPHVPVHVTYDAPRAAHLEVFADIDGVAQPFFAVPDVRVARGRGHRTLVLTYGGSGAPATLTTDRIRVRMVADDGKVLFEATKPIVVRWRSDIARLLSLDTVVHAGETAQSHVRAAFVVSTMARPVTVPGQLHLVKGDAVAVTAPVTIATPFGQARFSSWQALRVDEQGETSPIDVAPTPATIQLVATDDIRLTAHYEARPMQEQLEPIRPKRSGGRK